MQDDSLQDDNLQDDRGKMIIFKIVQFARLQATNENVKNEKRTNLKELPRPYKLLQSSPAENVEGGIKKQDILSLSWPSAPPQSLRRGLATSKTLFTHHRQRGRPPTSGEGKP